MRMKITDVWRLKTLSVQCRSHTKNEKAKFNSLSIPVSSHRQFHRLAVTAAHPAQTVSTSVPRPDTGHWSQDAQLSVH